VYHVDTGMMNLDNQLLKIILNMLNKDHKYLCLNTQCSTTNQERTSNEVKKYPHSITKSLLHENQDNFNSNVRVIHLQITVKN